MHPIVRSFSERAPRLYGALFLTPAVGLSWLGLRGATLPTPDWIGSIFLFAFAIIIGLTGLLYIILGKRAVQLNARFDECFDPDDVGWKPVTVLLITVAAVFAISILIALLLRSS